MTDYLHEHLFDTRAAASSAAAQHLADSLAAQLANNETASLIVTGGSSPLRCYAELAAFELEWERVRLLLSDERWVESSHADSNEKMLRENLLLKHAAAAHLLPIYERHTTMTERCRQLNEVAPTLPTPIAAAVLGMGDDGHIASLFPDADNLAQGLDPETAEWYLPIVTEASPHPRISMTLAALKQCNSLLLLFFGQAKRDVYEQSKMQAQSYPVAALLTQQHAPVHVYWAP